MSKKTPEYLNYFLEDCLQGDKQFTKRAMFSGYAIYKNRKVFCLYLDDVIYFKVGENNIQDYKEYNSKPFSYDKKNGKIGVLSYYELPETILDDREELDNWIEKSLEVETRTNIKKKSKKDIELDKNILKLLLQIPKGKVTTYKILADKFGVHPRRIASVMKMNKSPEIYPCYKVVAHSGKIGGYSGPDGVYSKVKMLEEDGIDILKGEVSNEIFYFFE